jgi:hypothetical protein
MTRGSDGQATSAVWSGADACDRHSGEGNTLQSRTSSLGGSIGDKREAGTTVRDRPRIIKLVRSSRCVQPRLRRARVVEQQQLNQRDHQRQYGSTQGRIRNSQRWTGHSLSSMTTDWRLSFEVDAPRAPNASDRVGRTSYGYGVRMHELPKLL